MLRCRTGSPSRVHPGKTWHRNLSVGLRQHELTSELFVFCSAQVVLSVRQGLGKPKLTTNCYVDLFEASARLCSDVLGSAQEGPALGSQCTATPRRSRVRVSISMAAPLEDASDQPVGLHHPFVHRCQRLCPLAGFTVDVMAGGASSSSHQQPWPPYHQGSERFGYRGKPAKRLAGLSAAKGRGRC